MTSKPTVAAAGARHSRRGILVLLGIASLLALVAAEPLARLLWHWQYNRFLEAQTGGYQVVDWERSVTLLKSGLSLTAPGFAKLLESRGKFFGAKAVRADAAYAALGATDIAFQVNQHGFSGPDCSLAKRPGVTRILTIGDSVTFGPYVTRLSYPRVMERELNRLSGAAQPSFEVINAGVQGYNIESVSKRLDDFLRFEPDIITVMIGWNQTILRADPRKDDVWYRRSALYRFYYHALVNSGRPPLQIPGAKENFIDPAAPLISELRRTDFADDFALWDEMLSRIRRRLPKCQIFAITLAGLFMEGATPQREDLPLAYSLAFTHNLSAWAVLTARYDSRLQEFAVSRKIAVIDLASWSLEAFRPRRRYFADSVHMTPEGYGKAGAFLAHRLWDSLGHHPAPRAQAGVPPVNRSAAARSRHPANKSRLLPSVPAQVRRHL